MDRPRSGVALLLGLLLAPPTSAQTGTNPQPIVERDKTASGTLGALNAAVTLTLEGASGVGGYLAIGTLSGTVTPEATVDGTNWVAVSFLSWTGGSAPTRAATITGTTMFQLELPAGTKKARLRVSSYTSGSGTGNLVGTANQGLILPPASVSVSGTITANQGMPASTANRWPAQITDGTDLALVTAAGEQNVLATAQPGVDIGDVTVNNASGASAVNVQDGGNSLTVDAPAGTP
ncbi:MAG TPA: hypothetical protein VFG76_10710, partial [Candidatus Polarisedimenticolia bacterium]|nr:hypothetical protein [Candidatus Polarisedimenticolia bacterium]